MNNAPVDQERRFCRRVFLAPHSGVTLDLLATDLVASIPPRAYPHTWMDGETVCLETRSRGTNHVLRLSISPVQHPTGLEERLGGRTSSITTLRAATHHVTIAGDPDGDFAAVVHAVRDWFAQRPGTLTLQEHTGAFEKVTHGPWLPDLEDLVGWSGDLVSVDGLPLSAGNDATWATTGLVLPDSALTLEALTALLRERVGYRARTGTRSHVEVELASPDVVTVRDCDAEFVVVRRRMVEQTRDEARATWPDHAAAIASAGWWVDTNLAAPASDPERLLAGTAAAIRAAIATFGHVLLLDPATETLTAPWD